MTAERKHMHAHTHARRGPLGLHASSHPCSAEHNLSSTASFSFLPSVNFLFFSYFFGSIRHDLDLMRKIKAFAGRIAFCESVISIYLLNRTASK